jgi:MFS family permease
MNDTHTNPRGIRTFFMVWFGQLVSLLGTTLTSFALAVWVYQGTESVTQYALIAMAATLPGMLISPIAGALVDRWDRRWAMILSDSGAACCTLFMALMLMSNQIALWHIYLATAISACFSAFQTPAYSAATTLLVPKQHYARASGMVELAGAVGYIAAPILAGFLLAAIKLEGVLLIDFVTFLFSLITLSMVRFPRPAATTDGKRGKGSLLREAAYGWSYIRARSGLLALLLLFAIANLFNGFTTVLIIPLTLSFTSAEQLGVLMSLSAGGFLVGGLLMSIWGGPKRRIYGVLSFGALCGLATCLVGLQPSFTLITGALSFLFFCTVPVNACSQAIWQSKVAPDVQGRVFSVRSTIALSTMPLAYLTAGPLADYVFEPLLAVDGPLAGNLGAIMGTGPGRGIGLMFIVMGGLMLVTVLGGALYPHLRLVECELPDSMPDPTNPIEVAIPPIPAAL